MKKMLLILLLTISTIYTINFTPSVNAEVLPPVYEENWLEINQFDSFNNVVIFIKFADEDEYVAPYNLEYYDQLFNGVDQVSLRDYYLEASYGQLEINSLLMSTDTEIIFYQDSYDRAYFEPYDVDSNPIGYTEDEIEEREHNLLARAVNYVDENNLIPESFVLDTNGDDEIDSITFMVSGTDEGWLELFWPHKWQLSTFFDYDNNDYLSNAPTINGKYAYTYTFELLGYNQNYYNRVEVGVLVHETFHLISAPDLYHYYRYDWVSPVGYWGIMEGIDEVPSHMLGYMKYAYGNWITDITEITESGTYTLYPLQESADNLYRINMAYSNEYIYLEYRDNEGNYESTLPDSGLLVYRVDEDYVDGGNEQGYYDDYNNPQDEVFVFRPYFADKIAPIMVAYENNVTIDEDGQIDYAALSQFNVADEMGVGTDIPLFYSDGSIMDLKIYNVVEHDGYITFDVFLDVPQVVLNNESDLGVPFTDNVILIDAPNTYYSASIQNTIPGTTTYYTTDGSIPTDASTLYTGQDIEVTKDNNTVHVAVYESSVLIGTFIQTFEFDSTLETSHIKYDDETVMYWYLNFKDITDFTLSFNEYFEIEDDYDLLKIYSDTRDPITYTGTELRNMTLYYGGTHVLLRLTSDQMLSTFYGFKADLDIIATYPDSYDYFLNGEREITIAENGVYEELGVTIVKGDATYYDISGTVNPAVMGVYTITYTLYDAFDTVVATLTRNVTVGDLEAPTISIIGDSEIYINVFDDYTEYGAQISDNLPLTNSFEIRGTVNTNEVGTYLLRYTVTDDSGNESRTVTRIVYVQDVTNPTATLNPGVDTIHVGDIFIDGGVRVVDNYDTKPITNVTSDLDTSVPGTYLIVYLITDHSGNNIRVKRYVTVLEEPDYDINVTCKLSVHTFTLGEDIKLPSCYNNDALITDVRTYEQSTFTVGSYQVDYFITVDDEDILVYTTYIFVIDKYDIEYVAYFDDKRGLYL